MKGLEAREVEQLISNLRSDIVEEQRRLTQVEALLVERRQYERRGEDKRIVQVDAQLAHYGYVMS